MRNKAYTCLPQNHKAFGLDLAWPVHRNLFNLPDTDIHALTLALMDREQAFNQAYGLPYHKRSAYVDTFIDMESTASRRAMARLGIHTLNDRIAVDPLAPELFPSIMRIRDGLLMENLPTEEKALEEIIAKSCQKLMDQCHERWGKTMQALADSDYKPHRTDFVGCKDCPNSGGPLSECARCPQKGAMRMTKLGLRLSHVHGITQEAFRAALPDWWDDEAAAEDAGYTEARMTVSRAFSIPLEDLGS